MQEQDNHFSYSYRAPTEEERREIDSIRRQYVPEKATEDKMERLRTLDKKVKRTPAAAAYVLGAAGVLVAGLGMTMSIEWNLLAGGIAVGVIGIALAAVAYPLYKRLLRRNKQRYGKEIVALTEQLLDGGEDA